MKRPPREPRKIEFKVSRAKRKRELLQGKGRARVWFRKGGNGEQRQAESREKG